jgi:hypothetical protein
MEERVFTCAACGALWRSAAAQQLIRKEGCLSCGSGPVVETGAPSKGEGEHGSG